MSTANDLPPWMRPENAPPPRFGAEAPATPGGVRYLPPAPSGLLTFVAVLNLVYSLGCGCVGGFYTASVAILTSPSASLPAVDRDQFRVEVERQVAENPAFSDPSRTRNEEENRRLAKGASYAILAAAESARDAEPARLVRYAAFAGSAAHVVMFVGAVLLLLRRPSGLGASILGTAVFVGAVAVTIWRTEDAAAAFARGFSEAAQDAERVPDLTTAERDVLAARALEAPEALAAASAAGGTLSAAWPVVALLILLLSRSIRAALAPPPSPDG